jgi:hypothetical protein
VAGAKDWRAKLRLFPNTCIQRMSNLGVGGVHQFTSAEAFPIERRLKAEERMIVSVIF